MQQWWSTRHTGAGVSPSRDPADDGAQQGSADFKATAVEAEEPERRRLLVPLSDPTRVHPGGSSHER